MKNIIKQIILITSLTISVSSHAMTDCPDVLKHIKRKLNSQETVNLCESYNGSAVLFVNTASKCGFTPQFEGLEKLYSEFKDQGLVILGFPSHSFNQEHADEAQTAELCELTYGVNFPMFETVSVKGDDADPLFAQLKRKTGKEPKWNFNKFLMNKSGDIFTHYGSSVKPSDEEFRSDIKNALK